MGVQGFPTLKIVRPGKKPGKPTVEDYQGQRTAKGIVEAVKDRIPNTVKRLTDKNIEEWLLEGEDAPKAILFSDKGTISATLKTLAIDFAGLIPIAQIRNKESQSLQRFGITKFPTLILLPSGGADPITFDGEMNKEEMVKFLSQVAPPNPDCPASKDKKSKPKADKISEKKASKASSKFSKASASHKSSEASSAAASATEETVEEPVKPSESPDPIVNKSDDQKPVGIAEEETKPTIPIAAEPSEVNNVCFTEKSKTCILAILPKDESSEAYSIVLASLAAIHKKYDNTKSNLFPFIGVKSSNTVAASILAELGLGSEDYVHLVATNAKRGWWKKYSGEGFGSVEVERWVDAIRMGEGKKEKLPAALITEEKVDEGKTKASPQDQVKIEVEEIIDDEEPVVKSHDEL
jgi:protein disulfide-isomerase A6